MGKITMTPEASRILKEEAQRFMRNEVETYMKGLIRKIDTKIETQIDKKYSELEKVIKILNDKFELFMDDFREHQKEVNLMKQNCHKVEKSAKKKVEKSSSMLEEFNQVRQLEFEDLMRQNESNKKHTEELKQKMKDDFDFMEQRSKYIEEQQNSIKQSTSDEIKENFVTIEKLLNSTKNLEEDIRARTAIWEAMKSNLEQLQEDIKKSKSQQQQQQKPNKQIEIIRKQIEDLRVNFESKLKMKAFRNDFFDSLIFELKDNSKLMIYHFYEYFPLGMCYFESIFTNQETATKQLICPKLKRSYSKHFPNYPRLKLPKPFTVLICNVETIVTEYHQIYIASQLKQDVCIVPNLFDDQQVILGEDFFQKHGDKFQITSNSIIFTGWDYPLYEYKREESEEISS